MKISFNTLWIQNSILVFILCVVVFGVFQARFTIERIAEPSYFFYALVCVVILLAQLLFLFSIINTRAKAIASARTAELTETQKLFVELYRNSPVPYIMIDNKGRIEYPNHAATHLFGVQEEFLQEKNIFEMFSVMEDEDGAKHDLIQSSFNQGVFVGGRDVVLVREDGSIRYGLLSIFPYGRFGSNKKGLMTIVDISKQKEIEKAKTEFVSLASHQLRTPLSSMKWNLELLTSPQFGTLTDEQVVYTDKLERNLLKMNTLIEDFLNVSQLELGTKQATFGDVQIHPFFSAICEEFEGRVSSKRINLVQQFDERVETIVTDESLLHMAVSNLVSNATKYTPEDGTVLVRFVAGPEQITISVVDSGVGIPVADQDKLFTKFFRAQNVRKSATEGTGLGLYIVKLAVEKIGGTITLSSEEGKGTAFDIVLPYNSVNRIM